MSNYIGTTFAPPFTEAAITEYRLLIDAMPDGHAKSVCTRLMTLLEAWWALPESNGPKLVSAMGIAIQPLDAHILDSLHVHIPWAVELNTFELVIDCLTGDVRNSAFHLLWFAKELSLNREPTTTDKVVQ